MHIAYLDLKRLNATYEPQLTAAAEAALHSGRYIGGTQVAAFESQFAGYVGAAHCVGVASGLDALTLILLAMKQLEGWNDGDEVIVPAFTFIATAEAVGRAGLTPTFCDVTDDFTMDAADARRRISRRTRALLPVHLYGHMADMPAICRLASCYGLRVVEDAAQAHGASLHGRQAGTWGDAAGFSFYPGKNLGALGDGGAVTTSWAVLAERIRMLANYGAKEKYRHQLLGVNSRLDTLQAALLSIKLPRLDADNQRRQAIARIYAESIAHPDIALPYGGDSGASVFHIYPILTPWREALQGHLLQHGVETLVHYPLALHHQPPYSAYHDTSLPHAQRAASCELSLPISPTMTQDEARYVAQTINLFKP